MTRTHAALQLLAHGPLSTAEFVEITGWPRKVATHTLYMLRNAGLVYPVATHGAPRMVYALHTQSLKSSQEAA